MLRFLLLTLTLCLGCALVIGAAVAVGRTQPPSGAVRWLHMDDCEQPCLMDVTLGKTSFGEAKQRLEKISAPPSYKLEVLASGDEHKGGIILRLTKEDNLLNVPLRVIDNVIFFSDGSLSEIPLFIFPDSITLSAAEVVAHYGVPICSFGEYANSYHRRELYFRYDNYLIKAIVSSSSTISWASPVDAVATELFDFSHGDPCHCLYWKGIAAENGFDVACMNRS